MPTIYTAPTTLYQMPDDRLVAKAAVLGLLTSAAKTIDIDDFAFGDKDIIAALEQAITRGIALRLLLDYSMTRTPSEMGVLHRCIGPIPVACVRFVTSTVNRRIIDHNKQIVVDGQTVVRGSLNLTTLAWEETNVLEVTTGLTLAGAITARFEAHWAFAANQEADLQPTS